MSEKNILIVDDEADIRQLLEITLNRMRLQTQSAENLTQAYNLLKQNQFDLCLTDMRLPDGDGINLVEYIQQYYPNLPVAVITAYGSMDTAIRALKAGAFDFITKPLEIKNLRNTIQTALKNSTIENKESPLRLIGQSMAIESLRNQIQKLSYSQAPIYISGESGTGKELVARLLHFSGSRADKPFIPVNCGAIPNELMESEFFGHKKGSFTGAVTDKKGLFQAADGGTLFLDEVADLPLHMQVKLLRAIQEKAIRPIGSHQEYSIDVRILSASHKNLKNLIENNDFREDLYYRINVIELKVPSLRERAEDIPLLAEFILEKLTQTHRLTQTPTLTPEAAQHLQHYSFPGNVRELENILERSLTLSENNTIKKQDLHLPESTPIKTTVTTTTTPIDSNKKLEDIEKETILKALEETRWKKTAAAQKLGITLRKLRYRLEKYNIE